MLELPLALLQARPRTFTDGHHGVRRPRADAALAGREAGHPRTQQVGAQDPRRRHRPGGKERWVRARQSKYMLVSGRPAMQHDVKHHHERTNATRLHVLCHCPDLFTPCMGYHVLPKTSLTVRPDTPMAKMSMQT